MVVAFERPDRSGSQGGTPDAAIGPRLSIVRDQLTRGEALRKIAADISGTLDLAELFDDVLDYSQVFFGADAVGLWRIDDGPLPYRLAAHRGLSPEFIDAVALLSADQAAAGMLAVQNREVRVMTNPARQGVTPELRAIYRREGIRRICFAPIVFREQILGLLALCHRSRQAWPKEELELARGFADQLATAMENARLYESVRGLAARLRAVQDLTQRLNRIEDVQGIGDAIVAEARILIDFDSIRVYRVDHQSEICEPIAFQGAFLGSSTPTAESLRVGVGEGLTGWVARHNEPVILADATNDPRGLVIGRSEHPESILVVPMSYEDRVEGVIVVTKIGRDMFGPDDEMTLSIFAGAAAQALVNASNLERLRRQQTELEHQLASQRRLLEVNERLLSTLDPHGVLELIADSLKTVVTYNSLTIYRIDHEAGVRQAVIARDRFADMIMSHPVPLGVGLTGWVIDHCEAVLTNEAHNDPRCVQVPGTPEELEAMIVVPLLVKGEVIGTLNVARVGDGYDSFSDYEFELTKLFAGQASIALQNAEAHRAMEVRAELDALTGLRNHGAFQRDMTETLLAAEGRPVALLMMDLDAFKAYNDNLGHPAGDALLRRVGESLRGAVRDHDRVYRYGGDEFAVILPGATRSQAHEVAERIRRAVASLTAHGSSPQVTISVGTACYPDDGRTKDDLVAVADGALYLSKPFGRPETSGHDTARDAYLSALNETALALMDRLDPTALLETIMHRAAVLMNTPNSFLYLVEPDRTHMVVHVGTGSMAPFVGYRLGLGEGLSGRVWQTGRPLAVEDYDAFTSRAQSMPKGEFGAVVGVPLKSGAEVIGVIGLAAGDTLRIFGEREIAALDRFAQLASIALDNARLLEAAQREVGERTRAEEALRASEERFRRLSDATSEALAIHRQGVILEVNQAFCRLSGYAESELIGRNILELVAPDSREVVIERIRTQTDRPAEIQCVMRDGTVFAAETTVRTIPYHDGQPARVVAVRDLRERKSLEDRLTRQAFYDGLTGLPNRDLLLDRVSHALTSAQPEGSQPIALIVLDLDRFKVINESLGHTVGDQLLVAVAHRLVACVRPGDTVARFGGDEFAILIDAISGSDEAQRLADRIDAELQTPFVLGDHETFISASMGIVVGQPNEADVGELLRDAEIALYNAKADATVRHSLFEPSMSVATLERLELESDLRHAIERGELRVHYQPLVDLSTDQIVGLEALVRWQHPTRGLVQPMSFIRLAEETGLIVPLGGWVLETACRQARKWQLDYPSDPLLMISVNLSARQFSQPDLIDQVAKILADTELDPGSLELEITESVVMDESEAGIASLRALRGLGVRLVLDDFGTGYSSLSYLKHLPLDTIKIDRSFVAGLTGDDANLPIVQAVISLAHGLGIDVTAEGIETAEQLVWLRELVCDRGQGYYYARPLPPEQIGPLLAAGGVAGSTKPVGFTRIGVRAGRTVGRRSRTMAASSSTVPES